MNRKELILFIVCCVNLIVTGICLLNNLNKITIDSKLIYFIWTVAMAIDIAGIFSLCESDK